LKSKKKIDRKERGGSSRAAHCSVCGVDWKDHLGISGTCKKLEEARSALKVIHTWAAFRKGEFLVPEHVWKLAWKALEASKPNESSSAKARL
jgi:hypothetical protein